MASPNDINTRMSKISKSFQTSLNKRLDKMSFKDQSGEEYEEKAGIHPDKYVYFVQRDEDTIELWKGDIQISGQGGGWEVVNALLLESSAVTQITGGANGETFRTTGSGDNDTTIDTPTYGQRTGQFTLTTRGRQEGQNWVTQNAPSNDFYILYNYQTAMFTIPSSTRRYGTYRGSKYVIELLRNGVRETITLVPITFGCHLSVPIYQSGSNAAYKYCDTYPEALYESYGTTGNYMQMYGGYYVTRSIHNGATTHGYYYMSVTASSVSPNDYSTRNTYPTTMPCITVSEMHYDQQQNAVLGTIRYLQEYPRSQNRFGQLGIFYDLETGAELSTPQAIFNVNHPQNYANELIMCKILKGESIT